MKPAEWVSSALGVLAFVVAVWTIAAGRAQEVRGARSFVRVDDLFARSSPRIGLTMTNIGPGVLVPDSFHLEYKGEDLRRTAGDSYVAQWNRFRERFNTLKDWTDVGAFEPGVVQAANGYDILIIVREHTPTGEDLRKAEPLLWEARRNMLLEALPGLTVILRYHSVYGEHFEFRKEFRRRPVLRRPGLLTRLGVSDSHWYEWQP
jgi:hypothetical protein